MGPCGTVVLLMVGVFGSAIALKTCAVDCSQSEYQHLTADPVNCKNFYICYDSYLHSIYPFTCEGSMFFDIVTNSCQDFYTCTPECEKCSFNCSLPVFGRIASEVDCGVFFECGTGALVSCSPDEPYYDGSGCQKDPERCCNCKPRCTEEDAIKYNLIPDLRNCTSFYLCLEPGIPELTHGQCPEGNFDAQTGTCKVDAPCIQPCA